MDVKYNLSQNDNYINNKYSNMYFDIIEKRMTNPIKIGEKHHILPKSIFPEFNKIKENLVRLTHREHFICHRLLIKMFKFGSDEFRKMSWAIHRMSNKYEINSKEYEIIRKIHTTNLTLNKGRKCITNGIKNRFINTTDIIPDGWVYGITRSREHEEKLANHRQNRTPMKEETKIKIGNSNKKPKPPRSQAHKEKISKNMKGRKITWGDKLKDAHTKRKEKIENGEIEKPTYEKKTLEYKKTLGKEYELTSPDGVIIHVKNLKLYAIQNGLCINALIKSYVKNKPVPEAKLKFTPERLKTTGWFVRVLN